MRWRILLSLSTSSIHTFTKLTTAISNPKPQLLSPLTTYYRHLHFHSPQQKTIDHSLLKIHQTDGVSKHDDEENETTNEFLSRFAWIMRKKVKESYPECDKKTIDGMLLVIVQRVALEMENSATTSFSPSSSSSVDFSEDLWKTVWEVSNRVLEDMNKERKKEKMKGFLQCDEVKEMCRFAGEVGIRGDLLRELRFKWAREKMEEHEFNEGLEKLKKEGGGNVVEEQLKENQTEKSNLVSAAEKVEGESESKVVVGLPKRKGKIRFKLYGLDLSGPMWEEVADKIHEGEQILWPKEAKVITGICKQVTEKIVSLKEEEVDGDTLLTLLAEWVAFLQPERVDWIGLLARLKNQNLPVYFKVAEMVLGEESFQANISDYSRLLDMYAREKRIDDVERILKKMEEKGIWPDVSTVSTVVHMYSKAGNLERATEAFEALGNLGYQADTKMCNALIMAYINAGDPKKGEALMREMETKDMKPTKEIYMSLLRFYSQRGDLNSAQRITTSMQFAGHQQNMETCTLLTEAAANAGDIDKAKHNFDYMRKVGHKPDDRGTAAMISAYEKKNLLDKALNLLVELEKDGFEPGVATYSVLMDWLSKMQLVDEAEQLLNKIALLGEAPPFRVQVSLCDMYARVGMERKALQTLGVLEARKDELRQDEFERIINGLIVGGFQQDAQRMHGIMEARGFTVSDSLGATLKYGRRPPVIRR